MKREAGNITVQTDLYTRVCLTVIAVLLTVLIVGLWAEGVPSPAPANAADDTAFGSSNAVWRDILKANEQTNAKLDEIITVLKGGDVKVQVTEGAPKAGGGDAPTKPK